MRRLALFAGVLWLSAGCQLVHLGPQPRRAPPPEQTSRQPMHSRQEVIEVKEIHASRVSARVISAKEVKARDGRVGRIVRGEPRRESWGGSELKTRAVSADVIHAKEIHAGWVEAEGLHAKEVKLGR